MRREASPAPPRRATAASRRRTAGPCSSTSWALSPCRRRTGCCAPSNMARSRGSAHRSRSRSTFASSQRPTRIFRPGRQGQVSRRPARSIVVRGHYPAAAASARGRRVASRRAFRAEDGRRTRMAELAGLSSRAIAASRHIRWPGNVRELRNVSSEPLSARRSGAADRRDQLRSVSFSLGAEGGGLLAGHAREVADRAENSIACTSRPDERIDQRFPRRGCEL